MNKKIVGALALSAILTSSVNAGVFVPETKYNVYTLERHMAGCGITESSQTTKYCEIPANTEEFKKRLETVNWYFDFDMMMRQKMFSEIVWDLSYNQVEYWETGRKVYSGKNWADKSIGVYSNSFDSYAKGYIRDKSDTEQSFKENVLSNLFSLLKEFESTLEGYNSINIQRENLIKDGIVDGNKTEWKSIYIGNIDEIEKLFKQNSYKNLVQGDKDKYDNIYFPNVRKYLELEKQWTAFYRDYSHFNDQDFKDLGYTATEQEKAEKGEYTNSFDNKVSYEYEIDQGVGGNILNSNPMEKIESEVTKKTKLQEYADKWSKDINKEYPAVEKVIKNYFTKYKKKKGITQSKVNTRVNMLKEKVPVLIESYEEKYNSTNLTKNKEKYKKYVWLLLLVEKVLQDNEF